jgi:hypothetical protein
MVDILTGRPKPGVTDEQSDSQVVTKTYSVHVRDVPESVWKRARTNALLSGLPFKVYVTRLLADSAPLAGSSSSRTSKG